MESALLEYLLVMNNGGVNHPEYVHVSLVLCALLVKDSSSKKQLLDDLLKKVDSTFLLNQKFWSHPSFVADSNTHAILFATIIDSLPSRCFTEGFLRTLATFPHFQKYMTVIYERAVQLEYRALVATLYVLSFHLEGNRVVALPEPRETLLNRLPRTLLLPRITAEYDCPGQLRFAMSCVALELTVDARPCIDAVGYAACVHLQKLTALPLPPQAPLPLPICCAYGQYQKVFYSAAMPRLLAVTTPDDVSRVLDDITPYVRMTWGHTLLECRDQLTLVPIPSDFQPQQLTKKRRIRVRPIGVSPLNVATAAMKRGEPLSANQSQRLSDWVDENRDELDHDTCTQIIHWHVPPSVSLDVYQQKRWRNRVLIDGYITEKQWNDQRLACKERKCSSCRGLRASWEYWSSKNKEPTYTTCFQCRRRGRKRLKH